MPTREKEIKKVMYDYLFGDNGSVTMAEFTRAFEAIITQILKFEKKLKDEHVESLEEMRRIFALLSHKIQNDTSEDVSTLKKDAEAAIIRALKAVDDKLRSIKQPRDGIDGIDGKDGADGYTPKKNVDYFDGKDGSPDTGEDIIKKVNKDKSDRLIKKEKVEGLKAILDWVNSVQPKRGLRLRNGGLVSTIVAGSGVTVDDTDPGNPIVSATGGISVKTATGDIDDSNTSFTMSDTCTLVIVNGQTYRHGAGCTISSVNVTLDNPVGTGGTIFGL